MTIERKARVEKRGSYGTYLPKKIDQQLPRPNIIKRDQKVIKPFYLRDRNNSQVQELIGEKKSGLFLIVDPKLLVPDFDLAFRKLNSCKLCFFIAKS
jgi:hypothetical protein